MSSYCPIMPLPRLTSSHPLDCWPWNRLISYRMALLSDSGLNAASCCSWGNRVSGKSSCWTVYVYPPYSQDPSFATPWRPLPQPVPKTLSCLFLTLRFPSMMKSPRHEGSLESWSNHSINSTCAPLSLDRICLRSDCCIGFVWRITWPNQANGFIG